MTWRAMAVPLSVNQFSDDFFTKAKHVKTLRVHQALSRIDVDLGDVVCGFCPRTVPGNSARQPAAGRRCRAGIPIKQPGNPRFGTQTEQTGGQSRRRGTPAERPWERSRVLEGGEQRRSRTASQDGGAAEDTAGAGRPFATTA